MVKNTELDAFGASSKPNSEPAEEPKQVQFTQEEKIGLIKSIAISIIQIIANSEFKLAEKGTIIKIPVGVTVQKKAVTLKAADIFYECEQYAKDKNPNIDNFETFLAKQVEILRTRTLPVDTFWKTRSEQTAQVHSKLFSFMQSQQEALKVLKNPSLFSKNNDSKEIKASTPEKAELVNGKKELLESVFYMVAPGAALNDALGHQLDRIYTTYKDAEQKVKTLEPLTYQVIAFKYPLGGVHKNYIIQENLIIPPELKPRKMLIDIIKWVESTKYQNMTTWEPISPYNGDYTKTIKVPKLASEIHGSAMKVLNKKMDFKDFLKWAIPLLENNLEPGHRTFRSPTQALYIRILSDLTKAQGELKKTPSPVFQC